MWLPVTLIGPSRYLKRVSIQLRGLSGALKISSLRDGMEIVHAVGRLRPAMLFVAVGAGALVLGVLIAVVLVLLK